MRLRTWQTLATLIIVSLAAAVMACGSNSNKPASNNSGANANVSKPASASVTGAAAPTAAATTGSIGIAKTADIGVALSLTQAAAVYGVTQKNGVQLAADEINASGYIPAVKLNLIIDDDASAQAQGISVFQKFISQDKVAAIIGPTLSNTAQAADPLAQQAKVPVLGISNTGTGITTIGDYIFRDSLAEADVVPQTVKQSLNALHYKKVAVFYANDDAFSTAGYNAFKKALGDNQVQIVDTETFSTNDKDFSAQLTKAKATQPDALVVSALINPAVGLTTQARQLGLTMPIIGGNGFNSPAFIQQSGKAAEGVIVGAAWNQAVPNAKSQAFIAAYKAKYNAAPDQFAAQAYAGVYILADAIKNAGSLDHAAIRDALAKVQNFDTVLGSFSFTEGRDASHTAVVQVVKNGQFAILQ
jgi:branched-chain amino acid transport system substrate-binding protein